ncbi:SMR family transporter [Alphaproteobacteria bacterium]|nr:SMR family transporter [Alphaproteobacteria bacterium]
MLKFVYLSLAIIFEVIGTISLKFSNGYTQILPTISSAIAYVACFYFLSRCLYEFSSIGFVYGLWAGLGIVLITLLGIFFFKNVIDVPGIIGISLIILGVLVLNLFSKMSH